MACQVGFLLKNSMCPLPGNPEMSTKKKAKRVLFGIPEPGSIDKKLKEENEKRIQKFTATYTLLDAKSDPIENRHLPKEMPARIAQEVKNYEEQQRQQKCNSNRANENNNDSDHDDDGSNNVANVENPTEPPTPNAEDPVNNKGLKNNCDRHKSSKKQRKLTNYFPMRKTSREEVKMFVTAGPLEELTQLKRANMNSLQ